MDYFSDRYGYTDPNNVFVLKKITQDVANVICTCYDELSAYLNHTGYSLEGDNLNTSLAKVIWTDFLHERLNYFSYSHNSYINEVATDFILDNTNVWYIKLNLLDFTIKYLRNIDDLTQNSFNTATFFINRLNYYFKQVHFCYRIVNGIVVEITSKHEIDAINETLNNSEDSINTHIDKALELYAQKPEGDFRNSIKESISAVEVFCREETNESTLGDALKQLNNEGVKIHPLLVDVFKSLYKYTNQPNTGIRHALMDEEDGYSPDAPEALFMLVSCCSFINYLKQKFTTK